MKIIRRNILLSIMMCSVLFMMGYSRDIHARQGYKISGFVLDANTNKPVELANISVRNSSAGTVSNKNGRFELNIYDDKKHIAIFSHVTYFKKELEIDESLSSKQIKIFLTPKLIQLKNIVVSAALYEEPLEKLSKSGTVISRRQIADDMQSNMMDVVASTPAFTKIWEYHSPLLLRGMNSKRLIVMQNGNRRIGTFPGGYFAQEMNIYDAQKIEIIKGPSSVIYGSGAISGIINTINKTPFGSRKSNFKILSGFGNNNNEFLEVARYCHKSKKFGISINGKYRQASDMVYGNGENAKNSDVEDRDLSLNTGYKFSNKQQITFNANYHYGDWGKPRGFNGPKKAFTEIRNLEDRLHSALKYTYFPDNLVEVVKFNLYYDAGTRDYYKYKYSSVTGMRNSLELVHYKDNYSGGNLFTVLNLSDKNKLTTGIDGYFFQLDNPVDLIDYYNNTKGKLPGYTDAGQKSMGLFLNDKWQVLPIIQLITGVRFDAATVNEGKSRGQDERNENRTAFSGNTGLVYSLKENMHLSLNLGRAFRMPTAEELFTEVISCKGTKIGNPDLQPEYSWNVDLGFRGHTRQSKFTYDAALFYNRIDDFINETADTEHDYIDFTYNNTDAKIMGGELSASYRFENIFKPANDLYAGIGGAYVYGMDLSIDEDNAPLFGIPPLKMTAELKYHGRANRNWLTGYYIQIQAECAAAQNRIADIQEGTDGGPWGYESSEAHAIINLSLGLNSNSLPGLPKLRVVARNIFNRDYHPFGSYIPAMGRNIKTVLSFSI